MDLEAGVARVGDRPPSSLDHLHQLYTRGCSSGGDCGRGTFITDNYNSLMVVRKSCRQELPRPAREVYISLKGSNSSLS